MHTCEQHTKGEPLPSRITDFLRPPHGLEVDFTRPGGAPALIPAFGISWEIFSNPVSLFIGGVASVLLELAEPSVRTGVWEHSSFQRDPLMRLRRTGFAAMITVYAPREAAETMIAHVVRMHDKVRGTTPDGKPYFANDERLLNWVQATASYGFCEAYSQYVRPLSIAEKDAVFAEGQIAARCYGALEAPTSWAAWQSQLAAMAPALEDSAILSEFLSIMESAPIFPASLRWLQKMLVSAAVEMTPLPVRNFAPLQARHLTSWQKYLIRTAGRTCRYLQLPQLPASQARQRMRRHSGI